MALPKTEKKAQETLALKNKKDFREKVSHWMLWILLRLKWGDTENYQSIWQHTNYIKIYHCNINYNI